MTIDLNNLDKLKGENTPANQSQPTQTTTNNPEPTPQPTNATTPTTNPPKEKGGANKAVVVLSLVVAGLLGYIVVDKSNSHKVSKAETVETAEVSNQLTEQVNAGEPITPEQLTAMQNANGANLVARYTKDEVFGELKAKPDEIASAIMEALYKETFHSDTNTQKYKNNYQDLVYVWYDPICPYCQAEIPKIEPLRQKGAKVVYVPVSALTEKPDINSDDNRHYQLLAPYFGKQDVLETLTRLDSYIRPANLKLTDKQKEWNSTNIDNFRLIHQTISAHYPQKYGEHIREKYGTIQGLGVPTVMFLNKQTGDIQYTNIDYDWFK